MPREDRLRVKPRPIRHAHPARRRGRGAGLLRLLVALASIALAVVILPPWDGGADGSDAGENAVVIAGSGAGSASRTMAAPVETSPAAAVAAPTLGPHGDLVTGGDPAGDRAAPRRIPQIDRPQAPPPPELLTGYRWPIQNARITNSFGAGRPGSFRLDGGPFHDGIDLSSFCGARITAAHDGVVLVAGRRHHEFQGWVGDLGAFRARLDATGGWRSQAIVVVVDDGNGYRSIYAHLGLAAVAPGEALRAGDLIGWQGASGNATGCHLHFAIFSPFERDTVALDPRLARKTKLPSAQIARIDPLLVLPPLAEAGITWGWGAR